MSWWISTRFPLQLLFQYLLTAHNCGAMKGSYRGSAPAAGGAFSLLNSTRHLTLFVLTLIILAIFVSLMRYSMKAAARDPHPGVRKSKSGRNAAFVAGRHGLELAAKRTSRAQAEAIITTEESGGGSGDAMPTDPAHQKFPVPTAAAISQRRGGQGAGQPQHGGGAQADDSPSPTPPSADVADPTKPPRGVGMKGVATRATKATTVQQPTDPTQAEQKDGADDIDDATSVLRPPATTSYAADGGHLAAPSKMRPASHSDATSAAETIASRAVTKPQNGDDESVSSRHHKKQSKKPKPHKDKKSDRHAEHGDASGKDEAGGHHPRKKHDKKARKNAADLADGETTTSAVVASADESSRTAPFRGLTCPPYSAEIEQLQIPLKHLPRKRKTSVSQKYDRRAHNCATNGIWNRVTREDHMTILENIVKAANIKRDSFVMDWGSGCGHALERLTLEYGITGLGIDVSNLTIAFARENTTKRNMHCVADGTKLDWIQSNTFDHVFSFGSIYHVYNRSLFCHVLRQLVRIVKRGGSVYNGWTENAEYKRNHVHMCFADLPVNVEILEEADLMKNVKIFPLKAQQETINTYSLVLTKTADSPLLPDSRFVPDGGAESPPKRNVAADGGDDGDAGDGDAPLDDAHSRAAKDHTFDLDYLPIICNTHNCVKRGEPLPPSAADAKKRAAAE